MLHRDFSQTTQWGKAMIDKTKVASFLAQGVGTTEIALAVGCEPSYITQLRTDPEIVSLVQEHRAAMTAQDVAFDSKLESAEQKALDMIEQKLPFANFGQSLNAFKILNGARKRRDGPEDAASNVTQVVLVMPVQHLPKYVTNQTNEIIEVEGRTMVTATPKSLERVLEEKQGTPALAAAEKTAIQKASKLIGGLMPNPSRRRERKLPDLLSPDVL